MNAAKACSVPAASRSLASDCLERKQHSSLHFLLCAISVFSVSLWLSSSTTNQPQRHREHRGISNYLFRLFTIEISFDPSSENRIFHHCKCQVFASQHRHFTLSQRQRSFTVWFSSEQRAFAKTITLAQHAEDRFLAVLFAARQLHIATLNDVHRDARSSLQHQHRILRNRALHSSE